jgi:hypothetical protein
MEKQVLPWGWPVGVGRWQGEKDEYSAKKCVHMYVNAKMIPVETFPEIGEGGMKEWNRG